MHGRRRTAVIVGVLFIVATGCYLVGQAIYTPVLSAPDYLALAFPSQDRVVGGLLIELVGVLAIPLIAVFFFPILKSHGEPLALAYVALRLLEATLLILVQVASLSLVTVSQAYLDAVPSAAEQWREVGSSLQLASEPAFLISVAIVFPLGALILNGMLYRARLVPRLISGWGFLGAALLLAGSLLNMFGFLTGLPPVALEAVLTGPIAVQEMALAGWLIVKGLAESA